MVAEETNRELSLSLTSGGSCPPMRDEHPLRWGSPQDPSSAIFTLDDGAEGMDRESLGNGITAMLDALNHAQGALRDVIVPTGQVFAWSCLLIFFFLHLFLFSDHLYFF